MAKKRDNMFGSVSELTTNNFNPDKTYQFWLIKKNTNSTLSSDKKGVKAMKNLYPISYPLKLEFITQVEVEKEVGGKKKMVKESVIVRHCPGEHEIFKHLQTPDDKIKKSVTKKMFLDGHINILGSDDETLRVLALDDRNLSKPNRNIKVEAVYFMRDEDAIIEKTIEVEDAKFQVESYIRNPENFDAVCAYARIILASGEYERLSANPKMIIQRMIGFSKGNPDLYMKGFTNPATLQLHYVYEAIEQGVVILNEPNNAIYFKDNSLIQQAPTGTDPVKLFVDKIETDTSNKSAQKYQTIIDKLPNYPANKKEEVVENHASKKGKEDSPEVVELKELIETGKERGVITLFGVAGMKWNEGKPGERSFMGFKPFMKAMEEEPEFASTVRNTLA